MKLADIFVIAGFVLVLATLALSVVSARYYVTRDIRGVREDLSGRKRQRRMDTEEQDRQRVGHARRSVMEADWRAGGTQEPETMVEEAPQPKPVDHVAEEQLTVVEVATEEGFVITRDVVLVTCQDFWQEGAVA